MSHILDNPAWNALATGNRNLGSATSMAAFFNPSVSPFVAIAEPDEAHLAELHRIVPFDNNVILVSSAKFETFGLWKLLMPIGGYQMVYQGVENPEVSGVLPIPLSDAYIDQMLALTKLTNPGPFLPKTIDFGHYEGILEGDNLIAMAGQRLHPEGFAEASAVCTHPDHLGKGYARTLLLRQINRIQHASEIPFLHVKSDNTRAIKIYESLGFAIRTEMFFYVLKK